MEKLYNLIILISSILSIIIVLTLEMSNLSTNLRFFLILTDWVICSFYIIDLIRHLIIVKNKKKYMLEVGIISLLSAIPLIESFRYFRVFSIIRLYFAVKNSNKKLKFSPAGRVILVLTVVYSIFFIMSEVFYLAEYQQNPNINNLSDALWWAFTTFTTVGYGDITAVTTNGRIIAAIMMIFGISAFTFTMSWAITMIRQHANRKKLYLNEENEVIHFNQKTGVYLKYEKGHITLIQKKQEHLQTVKAKKK